MMPLEWINNYEEFHSSHADVHTTAHPLVHKMPYGTVRSMFQKLGTKGSSFPPRRTIASITPIHKILEKFPVDHFTKEGHPFYVSHMNGHFLWDIDPSICDSNCECHLSQFREYLDYDSDCECYETLHKSRRNRKKKNKGSSYSQNNYQRNDRGDQGLKVKVSKPIPKVPTNEMTMYEVLKELGHDDLAQGSENRTGH
ncbi:hypothetical protein K1719_000311 [Acacia pycnantha]|nr:hypothetical protein K1719_000311 [Acacia pycnantha]